MTSPFSTLPGRKLLDSLREIFTNKKIYQRQDRFIVFVCGGKEENSFRQQFIDWAQTNLPEFICIKAEDALMDSFAGEGRTFTNLTTFESIIASISDCVLIFPESAGSYAEVGVFATNSEISVKTLVVNPYELQPEPSFLNHGPIDTIDRKSFLKVLSIKYDIADFVMIRQHLLHSVKWPNHRERISHKTFGKFTFKEKLFVVFETLRFLRLADEKTLRQVIVYCFGGNPQYQELRQLLRILQAGKFIERNESYFKVIPGMNLTEIEHLEVETVFLQFNYFYQHNSPELYKVLHEVAK